MPDEIVAPNVIPDTIPDVVEQLPPPSDVIGVEGGVEGGIEGGQVGGVLGGEPDSVVLEPPPDDGRIHIARDQPLELPVDSQTYPIYPGIAVKNRWEDSLVVRYVIGRNGRVKEVTIVRPPKQKVFEEPTLEAIRTWRFRRRIPRGEEAKDIVHELTVYFKLRRTA